jgi:putative endonuclease
MGIRLLQEKISRQTLADRRGRRAEWFAAALLLAKGYSVLEQRVRHPAGEIDLIVLRGKVLAFVEVKARKSLADASSAVLPAQRTGIVRAATSWAASRPWAGRKQWRYDVVAVVPWRLPVHIKDAWRPDFDPVLHAGKSRR